MFFIKTLYCALALWQVYYLSVSVGSDANAVNMVYDLECCPLNAYHDYN